MEPKFSATDLASPELFSVVSELITTTGEVLERRTAGEVDTHTELVFLAFTLGSVIGIAMRQEKHAAALELVNDYLRAGIAATQEHCVDKVTVN